MARKKKRPKLKVDLDLPKDDNTLTRMYLISGVTVIIGLLCLGFWFSNSTFMPGNDNAALPFFVTTYCKMTAVDEYGNPNPEPFELAASGVVPEYVDNETCNILRDSPSPSVWKTPKPWDGMGGKAKTFQVPGLEDKQLKGKAHPTQELFVTCDAQSNDFPSMGYAVSVRDANGELPSDSWRHIGVANEENDGGRCKISITGILPGEYRLQVEPEWPSGVTKEPDFTFDFTVTAMTYDGIPNYMNNKSLWIGPEVNLGPFHLRPTIYLNFFGFGFFMMIYPAAVYWDGVQRNIYAMEDKFPDFLRDLAEYWKGGLSMTIAVQSLANSEYGALNNEVRKMSNQISWGIAFGDVLILFADRVGTPLVKRAVSLIIEANKAGGKISDILVTAASDSREIKFLQQERLRTISSYIAVIWMSYIVFLGVIVVLSKVFIPAIAGSNSSSDDSATQIGNMQIRKIDPLFFLTVFFYGVSMQAIGNGAMAGLMATGRFSSGMKHAGRMLLLCILCFNFITFTPDLIGVPISYGLSPSIGTIRL